MSGRHILSAHLLAKALHQVARRVIPQVVGSANMIISATQPCNAPERQQPTSLPVAAR